MMNCNKNIITFLFLMLLESVVNTVRSLCVQNGATTKTCVYYELQTYKHYID